MGTAALFAVDTCGALSQVNMLWIAALPPSGSRPSLYTDLQWKKVSTDFEASFDYVANDGNLFYFLTNKNAPRRKVMKVDIDDAGEGVCVSLYYSSVILLFIMPFSIMRGSVLTTPRVCR